VRAALCDSCNWLPTGLQRAPLSFIRAATGAREPAVRSPADGRATESELYENYTRHARRPSASERVGRGWVRRERREGQGRSEPRWVRRAERETSISTIAERGREGERERERARRGARERRTSDRCGKEEGERGVRQGRPVDIASRSASRTGLERIAWVRRGRRERGNEQDGRNRSLVFRHGPDNVRYGRPLSRLVNRSIYVCICVFSPLRHPSPRDVRPRGVTSG